MTTHKHMNYPPILLDAWTVHEALRKLGFSAEDIYLVPSVPIDAPHTGEWLCVVLRAQGKEFVKPIGPIGNATSREALYQKWSDLAEELKTVPRAVLARIYSERFLDKGGAFKIAKRLLDLEFVFPRSAN